MEDRSPTPAGPDKGRFGMNGQESEKDDLGRNLYTAEYWEYDSRIGRRWNRDPVVKPWESPYACFNNNQVYYSDPSGLEGTNGDNKNPVTSGTISEPVSTPGGYSVDVELVFDKAPENFNIPGKSRYNGTGNLMIILSDQKNQRMWDPDFNGKKWDYVLVNNLKDAQKWIDQTYRKDNKQFANLIIDTHSSGWLPEELGIYAQDEDQTKHVGITGEDLKLYKNLQETFVNKPHGGFELEQIGAIYNILDNMGYNSDLCLYGCELAKSDEFVDQIYQNVSEKGVYLYTNYDQTRVYSVELSTGPVSRTYFNNGLTEFSVKGWRRTGARLMQVNQGDVKITNLSVDPAGGFKESPANSGVNTGCN